MSKKQEGTSDIPHCVSKTASAGIYKLIAVHCPVPVAIQSEDALMHIM